MTVHTNDLPNESLCHLHTKMMDYYHHGIKVYQHPWRVRAHIDYASRVWREICYRAGDPNIGAIS